MTGSSTIGETLFPLSDALSTILAVIGNVNTEASRVDVAVTKDEEGTKNGLREEIQNSVEDSLCIGRDDVATLAKTESNRIDHPENECQGTAHDENLANVAAKVAGVGTSLEDKQISNPKEGNAAKGEVSPFVRGPDESTNESGYDHNLVDQDSPENGRPWHAGGEEEVHEEERSGDEPGTLARVEKLTQEIVPINVADEVDLTVVTTFLTATVKLDSNRSPADV